MIFGSPSLIDKIIFYSLTALFVQLYFSVSGLGLKILKSPIAKEAIVNRASDVQGPNCTYSITPYNQAFPAAGGNGTITITGDPGCNWDANIITRNTPELPRTFLDTAYTQSTGNAIFLAQGGDFQAVLDAAQPGDVISLQAGAVFTGNYVLPAKQGDEWIVIRSSAPDSSLPAPGIRITPADAGQLPKIVSPNGLPALQAADGAHHYRLVALEITVDPAVQNITNLILFGAGQTTYADLPHDLIVDRSYIHGHQGTILRRGLALNSASSAVIDSYISDCHEEVADSQAIIIFNSPGPLKIVNNYLEGAGENIMFGGADPTIPNLVPSDIEFRNNHCYKPLSWKPDDPGYGGRHWAVKNLFELKNAQRILIYGNIFENNWADAQNGFAILFTVRNQDGAAPWSIVQDVTFSNNIVRHSGSGINIHRTDDVFSSASTARIKIANNLFEDIDGARWSNSAGMWLQIGGGPGDLVVVNNTSFQSGNISSINNMPTGSGFLFANNITLQNLYGFFGTDHGYGTPALDFYFPGYIFQGNVIVGGSEIDYPSGNFFPLMIESVGFIDYPLGNYRLRSTSPYRYAGVGDMKIGCDIDLLESAINGSQSFSSSGSATFFSTADWITITSVPDDTGNGVVNYTVAQNSGRTRVATIIIAGHTFTVTQHASGIFTIDGKMIYGINPTTKVKGVTMMAAGSLLATATTNDVGVYDLTGLEAGSYTVTPSRTGDVNGITAFDASLVARHAAQLIMLTPLQRLAGDVSGNGSLSAFDASLIARFAAQIPTPGSLVGAWKFLPANRTYLSLSGDPSGEDYEALLMGDVTGNWVPPAQSALMDLRLEGKQIPVSIRETEVGYGSEVMIPIRVEDLTGMGVSSYEFEIAYDQRVIRPKGVEWSETISRGMAVESNAATPGRLRVTAYGVEELEGSGTLLNLKFDVVGVSGEASEIEWKSFLFNEMEQIRLSSGSVRVWGTIRIRPEDLELPQVRAMRASWLIWR